MLPAPPGPFRPGFFRSPLRGPWLTSALGSILLVLITIVAMTGFLSHAAYMPDLRGNAIVPVDRDLPWLTFFDWPTGPSWLYAPPRACTRTSGWSRSRSCWPSCGRSSRGCSPSRRSPARRRRSSGSRSRCWSRARSSSWPRASMNAQYWYPFKFNFVVAHYYGAIVFVASLVLHVIVKMPVIARAYRERGRAEAAARQPREHQARAGGRAGRRPTRRRRRSRAAACSPSPVRARACCCSATSGSRSAARCASSRCSRRGARTSRSTRRARGGRRHAGDGRAGLPARAARRRQRGRRFTREELLALPQRTARLPIACVEGWSTTQEWTGVQLVGARRARGRAGRLAGARGVAAARRRAAPRLADAARRSPPTTRCWR